MKKALLAFILCLFSFQPEIVAQVGVVPGMGGLILAPPAQTCNTTPIQLTSTGANTWTNNTGCTNFEIQLISGGGSGAARILGSGTARSSGGAGGCFAQKNSLSIGSGTVVNYTVGAAASAVSTSSESNGNSGNPTFFNGTTEGSASVGATGPGGGSDAGSAASQCSATGDVTHLGGASGSATCTSTSCSTGGGGAAGATGNGSASASESSGAASSGGAAGSGSWGCNSGAGGAGTRSSTSATGGTNYGGGGGGVAYDGSGSVTSGAGAQGCIYITPLSMNLPENDNYMQLEKAA